MDSSRLAVKLFVEDSAAVPVREFVPVFHHWIQNRSLEEHQLIDVGDYAHVDRGPGVVLVAHEANIYADLGAGDGLGLMYVRKAPLAGSFRDRLRAVFARTVRCAGMLEGDPALHGRLRFRTDRFLFRINDRFNAPNTQATFDALQADLRSVSADLYGSAPELSFHPDPQTLFEVRAKLPVSVPLSVLADRTAPAVA